MTEANIPWEIRAKCTAKAFVYGSSQVAFVDTLPGLGRALCEAAVSTLERKSCTQEYLVKYPQRVAHKVYNQCVAEALGNLPDPCHGYGRDDISGQCLVTIR